jgi:hypothetical protein
MRRVVLMMSAIMLVFGCHHVGSLDGDAGPDTDTDSDTDTDTGPNCIKGEYTGDINIETQSDVATFAGYTSVSGYLRIFCPSCIDLSKLICLTSVGGYSRIYWNTSLTSLNGLSGITSVGGSLTIGENYFLTNLDGLSSLTSVGLSLSIGGNHALPDCEACDFLDQLTTGPTDISVWQNLDDSCTPVPDECP